MSRFHVDSDWYYEFDYCNFAGNSSEHSNTQLNICSREVPFRRPVNDNQLFHSPFKKYSHFSQSSSFKSRVLGERVFSKFQFKPYNKLNQLNDTPYNVLVRIDCLFSAFVSCRVNISLVGLASIVECVITNLSSPPKWDYALDQAFTHVSYESNHSWRLPKSAEEHCVAQ